MKTQHEHASEWLRKAAQDLAAFRTLRADPAIAVEQIGSHAQQAAEKMLKAVLAFRLIDFPFTHNLTTLIELCAESGSAVPEDLIALRFLTPFAVRFRYTPYPVEESEPFAADATLALLTRLYEWARTMIEETP